MDPPKAYSNGHNGHSRVATPARRPPRSGGSNGAGKQDKELAEWIDYAFGNGISIRRNTDMPDEAILPFMVMRMQSRLCNLTGGPNDPDLLDMMMEDFHEYMISRNRQGRKEMLEIIASGITKRMDEVEGELFGKL